MTVKRLRARPVPRMQNSLNVHAASEGIRDGNGSRRAGRSGNARAAERPSKTIGKGGSRDGRIRSMEVAKNEVVSDSKLSTTLQELLQCRDRAGRRVLGRKATNNDWRAEML